jgi:hypothetical protein
LVTHLTSTQDNGGSNPSGRAYKIGACGVMVAYLTVDQKVGVQISQVPQLFTLKIGRICVIIILKEKKLNKLGIL